MINQKEIEKVSGIYKIINLINGKFYLGSSNDCHQRWIEHLSDLRRNRHHSIHLQRAWNKYGKENFIHEIVEIIEDINMILDREQFWLDNLQPYHRDNGYNICSIAGKTTGFKHSDETKQLLSKLGKGLKRSEETKKRMSENSPKYWLGKQRDQKFKDNLSINRSGNKNGNYGRKHTGEELLRMRKVVYQYNKEWELIKIWDAVTLVKDDGFDPSAVAKCCNGKLKHYKKFYWSYFKINGDEISA